MGIGGRKRKVNHVKNRILAELMRIASNKNDYSTLVALSQQERFVFSEK